MNRPIALLGAPSSIGIKPYDDGTARQLDRAPQVLRSLSVVERLGAIDAGDVVPAAYRDFVRPPHGVRNEAEVTAYSATLGERVALASRSGHFVVLLGGDCSVVLGSLLGVRQVEGGPVGLAYVDAHADFATPAESLTGSAASMCLGLAVGRGDTPLARLGGEVPLVSDADVVLLGRRDEGQPYGHAALAQSRVLDLPDAALADRGFAAATADALERLTAPRLRGFWIHLDADVIDPREMPAVDSPEPGGPTVDRLVELIAPLVHHPRALGLELTIYDPKLDPARVCASRLVALLETVLGPH
ncbi:MAG: arginase [Geminicoccaceae bacterium]|nr:arginase [Geminicoccaceae bacterium]